jgi:FkbM family methyltransferase
VEHIGKNALMILIKINSFFSYVKTIGLITTLDYILQRYIMRKEMIVLGLVGIKEKIYLRRNSKDINVFQQIFIQQDLAFIKGRNCKICVDAGANIGLSTIYIKNLFPDAHIYSIEPEFSNVEMLRLNTIGYKDVEIIDKALSEDSNGLFLFDTGKGTDAFQTHRQFAVDIDLLRIESISINELMIQNKLNQLDFVKMDIEGAEAFCINQRAMEWILQSKLLAIEIHEEMVPGCKKRISELLLANFKQFQNGEYSVFENLSLTNQLTN